MIPDKRFNVFDVDGTVFLEDHREGSYHIGEKNNVDINCLNDIANLLNKQAEKITECEREVEKLKRITSKLELEICQYLNDKQAKSKWGENYD